MSNEFLQELAEELKEMSNERERLTAIIEQGEELATPQNLSTYDIVPGCVSKVWLHIQKNEQGNILISGWAEALIVRGYVAVLIKAYTGKTSLEIMGSDKEINTFITHSKLPISTIPSRNNAFANLHAYLKKNC